MKSREVNIRVRSYKVEVNTYGDPADAWTSNVLRFPTRGTAAEYGSDLAWRWTAVRAWRVTESSDPVTEKRDEHA